MKILLLCNKPPYPASEGGPMAMNSIITGLLEAGHQVKILAINSEKYNVKESDIPEDYKRKTGIELIDVDLDVKPMNAFLNLFTKKSYHVERFISKEFSARLIEVLEKEQFDVVQLEMLYMAPYVDDIRAHSKAMIVLRAHNVEHKIWERIAKETKFFISRVAGMTDIFKIFWQCEMVGVSLRVGPVPVVDGDQEDIIVLKAFTGVNCLDLNCFTGF
jgi:hypothetical protein